jgi:archaellin
MLDRLFSWFLPLLTATMRASSSERGQTGMEIALVGVVCATCVLGTAVIATSDEASRQLDSVFRSGIQRASGTLVLNGAVVATADGTPANVAEIVLNLGVIGRPGPVSLSHDAASERLVVAFRDETTYDPDVPYTATEIVGDHDGLLEAGETAVIRVATAAIADGALLIGPLDAWTLEVSAPFGGLVEVSRTMPFALDRVNDLH